jgi:hypothetical protein
MDLNRITMDADTRAKNRQYYHPMERPDTSWNKALAGKTVSSKGMNVVYDENGYAVKVINCQHANFQGTTNAVLAPSIDAVLSGGSRVYSATAEDLAHLSNEELEHLEQLRKQVSAGEVTAQEAFGLLERIRSHYGYHGNGFNEFAALEPVNLPDSSSVPDAASQLAMAMMAPPAGQTEQPAAQPAEQSAAQPVEQPVAAGQETVPNVVTELISSAETAPAAVQTPGQTGIPYVVTEPIDMGTGTAAVPGTGSAAQGGYAWVDLQQGQGGKPGATLFDPVTLRRESDLYKALGDQKKNELFDTLFERDDEDDESKHVI